LKYRGHGPSFGKKHKKIRAYYLSRGSTSKDSWQLWLLGLSLICLFYADRDVNLKLSESGSQRLKIFVNIIVLAAAFYGVSRRSFVLRESSTFERAMIDFLVAPLQQGVSLMHGKFSSLIDHYIFNVGASRENDELKKRVSELQEQVFSQGEVERENERLKNLLAFGGPSDTKRILAQIVSYDGSSDFRVLRINKGSSDGIKLQSTVVTADGVVGYIYRLTKHFADILTIIDTNNRVDVLIQRTRSHGIVEGHRESRCMMKYVSQTDPIILGDEVITSGLGNVYPKGLRVGTVSRIERESYGITQEIEVTPAVDFTTLEEVVVLSSDSDGMRRLEWQALDNSEGDDK